jgi:hypothetical protein
MGKQKPTDNLPMGDEALVYYDHKPMLSPSDSLVSVCSAARLSFCSYPSQRFTR